MQLTVNEAMLVTGRVLLGGLYVYGGIVHFFEIPMLVERMSARGVPAPKPTLIVGSLFQAVAGILLMSGLYASFAAYGLILFTIIASIMFLNFWDMRSPAREALRNSFFSNLALIGGLLIAATQP